MYELFNNIDRIFVINLKKDSDQKEVLSMVKKDEKLNKYIESKEIKKQIFVKNKIMNLII